jgi:hypothetical protein
MAVNFAKVPALPRPIQCGTYGERELLERAVGTG